MKRPNPIVKLAIDGYTINSRTTYEQIDNLDIDAVRWAFFEYQHHIYPTTMMLYMTYHHPNSVVVITPSNHKAFNQIKREMPYTFDGIGTPEHIKYLKESMNLEHEIGSKEHLAFVQHMSNFRLSRKTKKP